MTAQYPECMEFTDKIQWTQLDSQNEAGVHVMYTALLTSSDTRRCTIWRALRLANISSPKQPLSKFTILITRDANLLFLLSIEGYHTYMSAGANVWARADELLIIGTVCLFLIPFAIIGLGKRFSVGLIHCTVLMYVCSGSEKSRNGGWMFPTHFSDRNNPIFLNISNKTLSFSLLIL